MGKRLRPFRGRAHAGAPRKLPTVEYLLEQGTLADIKRAKIITEARIKYQWQYYSELAHQRSQIHDKLKEALQQSSIANFSFSKWQRTVKYKYGLHPLSTIGSTTNIGGRFNMGVDINPAAIASFPALYLAIDKDTALQETLGQPTDKNSGLSARDLALTSPESEVTVSVSGELEKVFDLRAAKHLKLLADLIKGFKLSPALKEMARQLGQNPPTVVKTAEQLFSTLLRDDWRLLPTMGDAPANSQIFGQLVFQAGIEGILYPSKLSGKDCLAIFPENFANTSSYIILDDEPPHAKVPRRIDSSSWRLCSLSAAEFMTDQPLN